MNKNAVILAVVALIGFILWGYVFGMDMPYQAGFVGVFISQVLLWLVILTDEDARYDFEYGPRSPDEPVHPKVTAIWLLFIGIMSAGVTAAIIRLLLF